MKDWIGPVDRYAEAVARQTGRLLATLATTGGARRRADWLLETVFVGVVDELEARGVPRRVVADMLGLSHRTLQRRYSAAAVGAQLRGRSVWVSVVDILRAGPLTRAELQARLGPVPPVVVASVLHDMVDSGWVAERAGRVVLLIEGGDELTPALLSDYVEVRRRVDPACTVEQVAQELGVEPSRVDAAWARSDALLLQVGGQSRWMVMQRCFEAVADLLVATADDEHARGRLATWWRVRLDDKPETLRAELQGQLRGLNRRLSDLIEPLATQADTDPGARFWTFVAFQSTDPDPEDDIHGR